MDARVQPRGAVVPLDERRRLSGLDFIHRLARGELPLPPICVALDFAITEVEPGRVVCSGVPDERFYNPMGVVHGGYAMTLLDSCMGCAIHSTLDAGYAYATLEAKVNFVRSITEGTGPLRAEGRVVHRGARVATAEGRLVDAAGALYAHGSTTCLVYPLEAGRRRGDDARSS